jgi:hypothetical protein
MKTILKLFISIFFLVLLTIATIYAVIKIILVFTSEQADEMEGKILMKLHNFMKSVKGGDE